MSRTRSWGDRKLFRYPRNVWALDYKIYQGSRITDASISNLKATPDTGDESSSKLMVLIIQCRSSYLIIITFI